MLKTPLNPTEPENPWWASHLAQKPNNTRQVAKPEVLDGDNESVLIFNQKLADLTGQISSIPEYGNREIDIRSTLTGEDRVVTMSELERMANGWKLHLNFDYKNPETTKTIDEVLRILGEKGAITTHKIGQRGGKEAGQPGKEATVYVGHRDKAQLVATFIDDVLNDILLPPEGDALKDDVVISGKVMGRFDCGIDPDFHQYGSQVHPGHPILNIDMANSKWGETYDDGAAADRARKILSNRYGEFFTGNAAT